MGPIIVSCLRDAGGLVNFEFRRTAPKGGVHHRSMFPPEKPRRQAIFHLLKNSNCFYFPLVALKVIYHYWTYMFIVSRDSNKWRLSGRVYSSQLTFHDWVQ